MRIIANFKVYSSITDKDAIPRLRQLAGEMAQRFMESGKVESSGIIPGQRGGFIVLDVDAAEELLELVGDAHEILDVDFSPTVPMTTLGEFFEKHPPVQPVEPLRLELKTGAKGVGIAPVCRCVPSFNGEAHLPHSGN